MLGRYIRRTWQILKTTSQTHKCTSKADTYKYSVLGSLMIVANFRQIHKNVVKETKLFGKYNKYLEDTQKYLEDT